MPRFLPDDWKGAFLLLVMVFVMSAFLDNIAAALIGGTVAASVFRRRVHIGYLAAIVAASNAGGSGSVVGDTTTTMMWIDGVSPWVLRVRAWPGNRKGESIFLLWPTGKGRFWTPSPSKSEALTQVGNRNQGQG